MDNRAFSKIGVLIILIVIVGGGILSYQYLLKPEEPPGPQVIPTDETTDWETYRNEKYGYTLKYPKKWTIGQGDEISDEVYWATPEKGFEVPWVMDIKVLAREGMTVNEWIQKDDSRKDFPYDIIKNIKVGTSEGLIVRDPVTMGNEYHVAFFPREDYMFSIGISSDPPEIPDEPVELLEKILSTFEFTD